MNDEKAVNIEVNWILVGVFDYFGLETWKHSAPILILSVLFLILLTQCFLAIFQSLFSLQLTIFIALFIISLFIYRSIGFVFSWRASSRVRYFPGC